MQGRGLPIGVRVPASLVLMLTLSGSPRLQDRAPTVVSPFDSGLIERTGISLVLLDVPVIDGEGNPMPGLTREDFTVQVNGREWEIYSLDDLCPVPADPEAVPAVEAVREVPTDETATIAGVDLAATLGTDSTGGRVPDPDRVRYVMYFDFSQLRPDGRERAFADAGRWLRETKRPADEVALIAYANRFGLRESVPFSSDRTRLLFELQALFDDPELVDPWPAGITNRIQTCCAPCAKRPCCRACCPTGDTRCDDWAWEEYYRGKNSLEALQMYLRSLESEEGRKALILYHQNGTQFPERWYGPIFPSLDDHVDLLEEVGADATRSRAVVYPSFTGDPLESHSFLSDFSVNLGANLADFTGGNYNRSFIDLGQLTDEAGRETTCTYRIGLRRRERTPGRVMRVKVWVGDRALDYRYRVQFVDSTDQWWREAQAVLFLPEKHDDVVIGAAVIPQALTERGWEVRVVVGLDSRSLMLFPAAGENRGEWEVGALMSRHRNNRKWEMLGRSQMRQSGGQGEAFVLHEREFDELAPGEYELRAFVRDRTADRFGAVKVTLELPDPKKGGVAGPLVLRADKPVLEAPLPLLKKERADIAREEELRIAAVPSGSTPISRGETLMLVSWVCPAEGSAPPRKTRRWIVAGGEPLFRFEAPDRTSAGRCERLSDTIETAALEVGAYSYWMRLDDSEGVELGERSVDFRVVEPPTPRPGTGRDEKSP